MSCEESYCHSTSCAVLVNVKEYDYADVANIEHKVDVKASCWGWEKEGLSWILVRWIMLGTLEFSRVSK